MLDPDVVLATVVTACQANPDLVTELGGLTDTDGNPTIYGHYFIYGSERPLAQAVYQMRSPSVMFAYLDLLGGGSSGFDGATIWKHRLNCYIRPRNADVTGSGASAPHLWWLLMNSHVLGTGRNLRQVTLLNGSLQPMETPTLTHQVDDAQMDFFVGNIVWPEWGDIGAE